MKEMVTLNRKEQKRLIVLNEVWVGRMTGMEAAQLLSPSLHHVRRLLAAYRKEGVAALAHGDRGRKPGHTLDARLKERVLELARSTYAGCNSQRFTELLQACCFKYLRTVGPDDVMRFGKHRLHILLANGRSSYPWDSLSF